MGWGGLTIVKSASSIIINKELRSTLIILSLMKYLTLLIFLFSISIKCDINGQDLTPPVPLPPAEEEIYKVVEEMPRFPGCVNDIPDRKKEECSKELMLEYIYNNLIYPIQAKEENIEGMAVVQFIIWKDGSIRGIKIVRNPGGGTGEEAARIVESMKTMNDKWRPGHQRGRAVCVQYTLPIKFKLEDKPTRKKHKFYSDGIYNVSQLDEDPLFPGCKKYKNYNCTVESLQAFINENQLYPENALENKTEGIVKISFVIEDDGTLSNIKALNNLGDGLSDDAVEIFKWMNSEKMRWRPGMKNYKTVRTIYKVDVAYDLEDWNSRN